MFSMAVRSYRGGVLEEMADTDVVVATSKFPERSCVNLRRAVGDGH